MLPETFQTDRLILRPIEARDARPIFDGYAQDVEVTRYLTWRPHGAIDQTERYVQACLNVTSFKTYVLTLRTTDSVVGAFDLRRLGSARLEFGYVLSRPFWGQGLMTEALCEVVDWALRQSSVWRIGAVADVENRASARVMEKAGLDCEAILRRWLVHPNIGDTPRDCLSFAKVR